MKRLLILLLLVAALMVGALLSPIIENPAVLAQVNTFCASNLACTVTGAWSFTGTGSITNLNGTVYVGGAAPQIGGSADIGAQLNAAYAALPSTGGKLILLPLTGGGCYSFSTPIVFNTAGKYVSLEGVFLGNQTGPVTQGTCLNYTPTTATTALTIDVTVAQGGAFLPSDVLRNIVLVNALCYNTVGGCGSSATGIVLGSTGGCSQCKMSNVKVAGFSVGMTINNGNSSWGMRFDNVWWVANATGVQLQAGQTSENMHFLNGGFANNATGFTCLGGTNTTDIQFNSLSFDVNSTAGINNTSCVLTFTNPHFENAGGTGASNAYIVQTNGEFTILGGRVMEDLSAGGPTAQFFQVTGGSFNINGINASAGRTVTNLLANNGGYGHVSYFTDAPTLVAPGANNEDTSKTCSIAYNCVVERIITNPAFNFQAMQFPVLYLTGPGAGSPAGIGGGFPLGVMYYNGSLNRTNLQDNGTAADNVNGTNNVLTASSTDNVTNKSFGVGGLVPVTAGATDIGSTAKPFGNLWIGTAATNNFKLQPASTTGARIITITDPVSPTTVGLPLTIANSTATMAAGSVAAATCATAVTVAATGVATTDSIVWAYATAPTLTTDALLHISPYVTAGNVNFTRCNPTAGAIVGTAIVINWRVIR